MSDTDNPTEQEPQAEQGAGSDASDLKARLGLRTRKRRVARPTGASLGDAGGDAGGNEAEAYPNDPTPLPQPLPRSDADALGVAEDITLDEGAGVIALKPLIVTLVVVAAVGLFLGSVLGGSLEQQGLRDGHASLVEAKLKAISAAKTKSGAELIPTLTAFQESLRKGTKALEEAKLAKTGGEKLRTEALKGLMADIKAFADDEAFIDPKRVMDDIMVLYAKDELLMATQFAVKTRHLYDLASAAVKEARSYDRMATGPFLAARVKAGGKGGASKGVLVRHIEREVPELGKIPAAEGSWILDTGKPKKVKLVDKKRSSNTSEQWEMMVVEVGKTADDAVQVPTRDVMTLDMTQEYESHAELIQTLKRDRLEVLVVDLDAVAGTIDWPELEEKLKARAAEAN